MTSYEAYLKISNNESNYVDVNKAFKNVIDRSSEIAKSCPIIMGGPGDMNILFSIAEFVKAKVVIETGVAYGWSSLALLLSLNNREGSKLISTDMPYAKLNNDAYVGCVVPENLKKIGKLSDFLMLMVYRLP